VKRAHLAPAGLPTRWRSWALGYAAALLSVTLVSLFILTEPGVGYRFDTDGER